MSWTTPAAPSEPLSADQLRAAAIALRRTKYREGYLISEVDELLDRAVAALEEHSAGVPMFGAAETILNVKFRATKFRLGYDQDDVDDLLDRVVTTLRTSRSAPRESSDPRPRRP